MTDSRHSIDLSLINKLVSQVVTSIAKGKNVTYQMAFLIPLEHRLKIECKIEDGELQTKEIDLVEFFT